MLASAFILQISTKYIETFEWKSWKQITVFGTSLLPPSSPNFNVVEYLNFRLCFWSLLVHSFVKKLEDENSTFKNNIEIGERGNCLTYFVVNCLKIETKTDVLSANFFYVLQRISFGRPIPFSLVFHIGPQNVYNLKQQLSIGKL